MSTCPGANVPVQVYRAAHGTRYAGGCYAYDFNSYRAEHAFDGDFLTVQASFTETQDDNFLQADIGGNHPHFGFLRIMRE